MRQADPTARSVMIANCRRRETPLAYFSLVRQGMMMEESLAIAITPQMAKERIWAGKVSLSEDCNTSPAKLIIILERKKNRRVKTNFHPWLHSKQSSCASANTRNENTAAAMYILIWVTLLGICMKQAKTGKVMNWAETLISVSKKMFMLSWSSMKEGPQSRKKKTNIKRLSFRKSPRTEPYLKRSKTFKVQLCFIFWFYLYSS